MSLLEYGVAPPDRRPVLGGPTHNELAHDLAMFLSTPPLRTAPRGRLTWENIEFPDNERCRPDVYSIVATLAPAKWCPVTYEVKVSRADFMSECRTQKWRVYLPFSAYIFVAFPDGLARAEEVPSHLGIITKGEIGWRVQRRGKRNPDWKLTERQWMNLCLKGRNPSPFEIFTERRGPRRV